MRQHAALLQLGEAEQIHTAVKTLQDAMQGTDHNLIRDLIDALSTATTPFAQRIMDTSIGEALGGKELSRV